MSTKDNPDFGQDVAPAEVGELVQRRRIEEIFSARSRFTETRREIANRRLSESIPQSKVEHALRTCIEEYTMYIEPLFESADDPRYWKEEIELGEITPPKRASKTSISLCGFSTILDTTWPMEFEIEVDKTDEIYGETSDVKIIEVDLPEEVSNTAFRQLNSFLRDHGVKYRMEEGLPTDEL